MAANAIETLELLNREHAARVEAEETGRRLLLEKQRAEALQRVGGAIAGRLELQEIVQLATDAARELTPASFGAFFYNVISDAGEAYMLYTLSGVERSAFERFPMPRNTTIFAPTFNGEGIVRLDDVLADPRYGHNEPYHGMPEGHLPVRSYLAVPVITSDGEVAGGLFFGHPEPGMFSAEDERMVEGIAAQSAIAIENARLYQERTRTAQTLQRALLPPHLPDVEGLELAATYRAAGEGNEVGGDFYDVFPQADGSWALVVGDVCGKGPEAAAVTALARYTLRAHAVAGLRPSYQLARLNDALLRQHAPGFVTVALARLELTADGARVEVATAGHPAPILARAGRRDAAGRDRHAARDHRAAGAARGHRRARPRRPARVLHRRRQRGRRAAAAAVRARAGGAGRGARGRGPDRGGRAPRSDRGRDRRGRAARRHRVPRAAGDAAAGGVRALPGDDARGPRRRRRAGAGLGRARPAHGPGPPAAGHRTGGQRRPPHRCAEGLGRGPGPARGRRRSTWRCSTTGRASSCRSGRSRRPTARADGGCTSSTSARGAGATNVEIATACGSNWTTREDAA